MNDVSIETSSSSIALSTKTLMEELISPTNGKNGFDEGDG